MIVGNMKVDASAMERRALLDSARNEFSPVDMDSCVVLLVEGCKAIILDRSPIRYVEIEKDDTSDSNANAITTENRYVQPDHYKHLIDTDRSVGYYWYSVNQSFNDQ